jgi:AbrB family looped-hinge helix DNA binding protein
MSELTRVGPRYQVTIPLKVRKAMGLATGELIQADVGDRGTIILRRKQLVDYDAELERDLAEAEADIKAGRVYGPYEADEAIPELRRLIARKREQNREKVASSKARMRSTRAKATAHARGLHR